MVYYLGGLSLRGKERCMGRSLYILVSWVYMKMNLFLKAIQADSNNCKSDTIAVILNR